MEFKVGKVKAMRVFKNKHLIRKSLFKSGFLINVDCDADDFFDKITDLAVKGQNKLMHDRWSKGLPWCYTTEKGENIVDYGVKKEYF